MFPYRFLIKFQASWFVTSRRPVNICRRFGRKYGIQNADNYLIFCTAQHPRRLQSSKNRNHRTKLISKIISRESKVFTLGLSPELMKYSYKNPITKT
jgi:hypothetical protein